MSTSEQSNISPSRRQMWASAQVIGLKHPNGVPFQVKPEHDPVWKEHDPMVEGVTQEMLMPNDFIAYSVGICHASCCTSLSAEDAAERMNEKHPTGISSHWSLSADKFFADGKIANGAACPDLPETHKHFLMSC